MSRKLKDSYLASLKIENIMIDIPLQTDLLYHLMIKKYLADGGDREFLWKLPLISGDVVVEGGGFKGIFSEAINRIYDVELFILEPVKAYYDLLLNKFKSFNSVHWIHPCFPGQSVLVN